MTNSKDWSLKQDLDMVLTHAKANFLKLDGAHLFITGGTGFIGCWFLESLKYAIENYNLNIQVTILTRDIKAFNLKAPHLANCKSFNFFEGELLTSKFPDIHFTHIIHGATEASADLNENNPLLMFNIIVNGTRKILDYAVEKKIKKVLFLSSGAVYGRQPWELERISEGWHGDVNCVDPKLTYAEGKRAAEMLCAIYEKQFGLNIAIARIFALLGPYLSLDIHFAAGNFIRDAIQGKEIVVNGNGKPLRSYLYAADLIIWLWHLLLNNDVSEPYNVGSDEMISIEDLARKVSNLIGNKGFRIQGSEDSGWNVGRYVPDTSKILKDYGLKKLVSLDDSILRTAYWHGWKG